MSSGKGTTRIESGTMRRDLSTRRSLSMTSTTAIQPSHARLSDASEVGLHGQHEKQQRRVSGLLTDKVLSEAINA